MFPQSATRADIKDGDNDGFILIVLLLARLFYGTTIQHSSDIITFNRNCHSQFLSTYSIGTKLFPHEINVKK